MNAALVQRALENVANRHVLVNLISSRVRQLNSGIGTERRPLIIGGGNLSTADTALLELIEGRVSFQMPSSSRSNDQHNRTAVPRLGTEVGEAKEVLNADTDSDGLPDAPPHATVNSTVRESARLS